MQPAKQPVGTSILRWCDIETNIFDYTNARLRKRRSRGAAGEMCMSTRVLTKSPSAVTLSPNKKM